MVGDMSVGLIKLHLKQKAFSKQNFDYIEKIAKWPVLIKDSYFQHKRKDFGLNYLGNCLGAHCKSDLMSFWHSVKRQDGELAKKLALLAQFH